MKIINNSKEFQKTQDEFVKTIPELMEKNPNLKYDKEILKELGQLNRPSNKITPF
jgi:hypothetical protein